MSYKSRHPQYKLNDSDAFQVATAIADLRRARKESQIAMADAVGVSTRLLQSWEYGETTPSLGTMFRLKAHFGCAWTDLLGA